jgi:hypothetical protein
MSVEDDPCHTAGDRQLVNLYYTLILVLFSAASITAILQSEPLRSANDRSRWSTVVSLVERGTYAIDEVDADPAWNTIDKVRHEGHFYSSKPPLFPTLVAGLYWIERQTIGWNLHERPQEVTRLLLLVVNFVPFFISLLLMIQVVERHAQSVPARVMTVTITAFATMLTSFQTTLNNHSVAASCLFFCLYCASRVLCDGQRRSAWFAATGFFAAMTCTAELPAALFGLSIFALMAANDFRKTLTVFLPAALVPLAGFFITNWIATGGWKPFYMYYGTEKYRYIIDGVPSYWFQPQGLDRNTESTATYFMHCVIGHHGVLSLTPVFLLSIAGWWISFRHKSTALRPIILTGAVLSVCVLFFYLTRTQNYNYGGNSAALRWMLWLIPFWLFALIPILDRYGNGKSFRWLTMVLLFASLYSVGTSIGNPWRAPWLYDLMRNAGMIDYSILPPELAHSRQTWIGSLPTTSNTWVEFTSSAGGPGQSPQRIRFTWIDDQTNDDVGVLHIDRTIDSLKLGESMNVTILTAEFLKGVSCQKFIRGDEPAIAELLTGMPRTREYQPGVIRYVRTPVRNDAFQCQRAASRVIVGGMDGSSEPARIHRCDVWLTPELPFGVAQVEFTVTNARDSKIVRREIWIATATSGIIEVNVVNPNNGDG